MNFFTKYDKKQGFCWRADHKNRAFLRYFNLTFLNYKIVKLQLEVLNKLKQSIMKLLLETKV